MFKDNQGNVSSMRVSMFVCVLASVAFGWTLINSGNPLTTADSTFVAMFLAAGIAGKVGQSFAENK